MKQIEYPEMIRLLEEKGEVQTMTILDGEQAGKKYLLAGEERTGDAMAMEKRDDADVFFETYFAKPRLVLCGAGHVGICIAKLASELGFFVTVIDDRPEFLTEERFPTADQRILCRAFSDPIWDAVADTDHTFYVLASRSHETDAVCAGIVLARRGAYYGMLGSKNKAKQVHKILEEKGLAEEAKKLICPMGLPLGGRRPMEVALSVAAQILQVRYTHDWQTIEPVVEEGLLSDEWKMLATVAAVSGATPRPVGSKMLIASDGAICGSIGGGITEYAVSQEGAASDASLPFLRTYDLAADRDGVKGMAGGGLLTVLFEPLKGAAHAE